MLMSVTGTLGMFSSQKQWWMDAAEVLDAWRVFPRSFMVVYIYILWDVHTWYKAYVLAHPSLGFPDVYVNVVWGAVGVMTGFYVQSGRKWGG